LLFKISLKNGGEERRQRGEEDWRRRGLEGCLAEWMSFDC